MIMPLHEKSIVSGRNVLGCWEVIAGSKRSIFLIGFVIRGRKAMTGSVFMKREKIQRRTRANTNLQDGGNVSLRKSFLAWLRAEGDFLPIFSFHGIVLFS